MRINKQFIASQGAKALPSKPGGCCGTAASKQFVFNPGGGEPCCGEISPPFSVTDGIDSGYTGTAQTGFYTIGGGNVPVTCPVILCFFPTASNLENDPRLNLEININGGQQTIPFGVPTCIQVQQSDSIQFTGIAGTPDICNAISIDVQNQTCGGPYYPIGNIYVNGDPSCTICPNWDLVPLEDQGIFLQSGNFVNTATGPITIRLRADNLILNFTSDVMATINYFGGGSSGNSLMQFGTSFGDIDLTLNPGDSLQFTYQVLDSDCGEIEISIENLTCQNYFIGTQTMKVNRAAC